MADPFKPDPNHEGFYYPNVSTVESPAGSGYFAPIDMTEDPAGSGLYAFTALAPETGAYWDWGDDGSTGRVSVTNNGTAPTWPVLRASGGMSGGFIATDITLGRSVRLDRLIPVGSQVKVNQRTGTASIDGDSNDISGQLTGREFFAVGPGETHQIQFAVLGAVSGTPQFAVDLSPAYL
jgi:hypothetical protein